MALYFEGSLLYSNRYPCCVRFTCQPQNLLRCIVLQVIAKYLVIYFNYKCQLCARDSTWHILSHSIRTWVMKQCQSITSCLSAVITPSTLSCDAGTQSHFQPHFPVKFWLESTIRKYHRKTARWEKKRRFFLFCSSCEHYFSNTSCCLRCLNFSLSILSQKY